MEGWHQVHTVRWGTRTGFQVENLEEEETRETLKGGTEKTSRGNGAQQGPCHGKPVVVSTGKRACLEWWVSSERGGGS